MFGSKEILLVEDNPNSRELTLRALKANHLADHVQIVSDGAEALDYVFRRGPHAGRDPRDPPALVVLDLKLPHVDGLEVLRQLRSQDCTRLIPVVIFSASRSESDIRQGYELGASGYVVKPVDYEQFTRVIGDIGRYWLGLNIPPSCRGNPKRRCGTGDGPADGAWVWGTCVGARSVGRGEHSAPR